MIFFVNFGETRPYALKQKHPFLYIFFCLAENRVF